MKLYTIEFLIRKLKLSLDYIDREVKSGRIERIGMKYQLNHDYGQERVVIKRKTSDEVKQATRIAMYVGRRYSYV